MDICLVARLKPASEFFAAWQEGDEAKALNGLPILFFAVRNTKADDRYRVSNFLMDRGASVSGVSSGGQTVLHVLLAQVHQVIPAMTELARRLLLAGVEAGARDHDDVSALQSIIAMKASDDELADFYDLWFEQPGLRVDAPNWRGRSPRELASGNPRRADLVKRMDNYDQ